MTCGLGKLLQRSAVWAAVVEVSQTSQMASSADDKEVK
jgi:hypothetical protein